MTGLGCLRVALFHSYSSLIMGCVLFAQVSNHDATDSLAMSYEKPSPRPPYRIPTLWLGQRFYLLPFNAPPAAEATGGHTQLILPVGWKSKGQSQSYPERPARRAALPGRLNFRRYSAGLLRAWRTQRSFLMDYFVDPELPKIPVPEPPPPPDNKSDEEREARETADAIARWGDDGNPNAWG